MKSRKTEEMEIYQHFKSLVKNKGYTLCEEWKNLNNFEKWYRSNKFTIDNEKVCLITTFANEEKILSPESVFFAPYTIKSALRDKFNQKEKEFQGIQYKPLRGKNKEKTGRFQVSFSCKKLGLKHTSVGVCDTLEEAKIVYKEIKEQSIYILAEMYKNVIDEKLYKKLKSYKYSFINEVTNYKQSRGFWKFFEL